MASKRRLRTIVATAHTTQPLALDCYLAELRGQPRLTPDEERTIAVRCRAGDEGARELLVRANLRFVVSTAKKYQNRGVHLADLISEGNVGLLLAADRFDPDRGFKFISFAVWWVRRMMQNAVNERRLIRVPPKQQADLRLVRKTADVLWARLKREPSVDEIAQVCEIPVERTMALLATSVSPVSLDAMMFDENDGQTLGDLLADDEATLPDDEALSREQSEEIERTVAALPAREAQVLRLYFALSDGREHTLAEIGTVLGISRERVRQIRERALQRMRDTSRISA